MCPGSPLPTGRTWHFACGTPGLQKEPSIYTQAFKGAHVLCSGVEWLNKLTNCFCKTYFLPPTAAVVRAHCTVKADLRILFYGDSKPLEFHATSL